MICSKMDMPFELKFLNETGSFEGYASVFNITDKVNDKIIPGAFKKSLLRIKQSGYMPPLLWQHNAMEPIGEWTEMYEDSHGLFVKGTLFVDDIVLAREAYKLLKEGVVTGLSIGYRVEESFREQKGGARVLSQVDLQEVSLVTFPANEYARVSNLKKPRSIGCAVPSEREIEAILRNGGLSRRQAKGVISLGYKALKSEYSFEGNSQIEALRNLTKIISKATHKIKI